VTAVFDNSQACRTNTLKPHKAVQPTDCESITSSPVSVPDFCCLESSRLTPLQS